MARCVKLSLVLVSPVAVSFGGYLYHRRKGDYMSAFESKKYSWRKGYSYKISADVVGNVLERIEKRDGSVSASSFLEESRNPESETHSMFEWNDEIAAEKYRLRQSAQIINQLEITFSDSETESISAYVNVERKTVKNTASFVNISSAMSDADMKEQVLNNALSELQIFKRKYQRLQEFSTLFDVIDTILDSYGEGV